MSIETTTLQSVARAAEQAARAHKRDCVVCGNTVRGARLPSCPAGRQLRADAAQARRQARESAAADRGPGPGDTPLFGTFDHHLECGHVTPGLSRGKRGEMLSCLTCQGQRRIISVSTGQANAGNGMK